jgi:hypothetical protein
MGVEALKVPVRYYLPIPEWLEEQRVRRRMRKLWQLKGARRFLRERRIANDLAALRDSRQ